MNPRILIVEDEALIAADLADALEDQGYDVVGVAGTGRDALARAEEQIPDLILLDVNLRGSMDGVEVARRLRPLNRPMVFLTAHGDPGTLARAEEVEPAGYLLKPFEERTLYATVRMALYRSQAEREREQRRALLASAVDRIGRVVFGLTPTLDVQLVNEAATRAGVALGQSLDTALRVAERPELAAPLRAALADPSAPTDGFEIVHSPTGSLVLLGQAAEAPLCLCAWCHRARDDQGEWEAIEPVLRARYDIELTHGICQTCVESHFADFLDDDGDGGAR